MQQLGAYSGLTISVCSAMKHDAAHRGDPARGVPFYIKGHPMKRAIIIAALSLGACNNIGQAPLGAIESILSKPTPETRKAEVVRQYKAVCPTPLSNDELEFVAQFVEENRSRGAVYVAGKLWQMNKETKICRGIK